jgi:hypothetical protein
VDAQKSQATGRGREGKNAMNRMVTFVPAMLLVFGTGTSPAMPIVGGQTPGAQSRTRTIQLARGDVVAERGELQAPRTAVDEHGVGAARAQDVQAPRADSVQAPRVSEVNPRLRED